MVQRSPSSSTRLFYSSQNALFSALRTLKLRQVTCTSHPWWIEVYPAAAGYVHLLLPLVPPSSNHQGKPVVRVVSAYVQSLLVCWKGGDHDGQLQALADDPQCALTCSIHPKFSERTPG